MWRSPDELGRCFDSPDHHFGLVDDWFQKHRIDSPSGQKLGMSDPAKGVRDNGGGTGMRTLSMGD